MVSDCQLNIQKLVLEFNLAYFLNEEGIKSSIINRFYLFLYLFTQDIRATAWKHT